MKSITSKLSIIILSLLAMAFTFVLGTTSSKAVSDETAFQQCVAGIVFEFNDGGSVTGTNSGAIDAIIGCAQN